ncbi:MAG: J domain-containing protein, partial [Actinomycetota bacterium]|nr:J domain-containing protein [Actinomycetota bacterium]
MDPRLLLGVGIRAGRSEVRAAHRRLRDAVAPTRGGTDELVRLVDAAAATLLGRPVALHVDAYRVLGVAPGESPAKVHAAYRRLVRLVHPDLGGTDELFRVVASAHEALTSSRRRTRRPFRPPSPPPPPGPYRAPP